MHETTKTYLENCITFICKNKGCESENVVLLGNCSTNQKCNQCGTYHELDKNPEDLRGV